MVVVAIQNFPNSVKNSEKRNSGLFKIFEIVSLFEGRSDLNTIVLYICSNSLYLKQSLTLHYRQRQS